MLFTLIVFIILWEFIFAGVRCHYANIISQIFKVIKANTYKLTQRGSKAWEKFLLSHFRRSKHKIHCQDKKCFMNFERVQRRKEKNHQEQGTSLLRVVRSHAHKNAWKLASENVFNSTQTTTTDDDDDAFLYACTHTTSLLSPLRENVQQFKHWGLIFPQRLGTFHSCPMHFFQSFHAWKLRCVWKEKFWGRFERKIIARYLHSTLSIILSINAFGWTYDNRVDSNAMNNWIISEYKVKEKTC